MKIIFEDKSILDIYKQEDKIFIIIKAVDYDNPSKKIINVAEIDMNQFQEIIKEINS